jgi:hypothetical protein
MPDRREGAVADGIGDGVVLKNRLDHLDLHHALPKAS